MNYCNPIYNNDGQLSEGDIAGLRQAYRHLWPADQTPTETPLPPAQAVLSAVRSCLIVTRVALITTPKAVMISAMVGRP